MAFSIKEMLLQVRDAVAEMDKKLDLVAAQVATKADVAVVQSVDSRLRILENKDAYRDALTQDFLPIRNSWTATQEAIWTTKEQIVTHESKGGHPSLEAEVTNLRMFVAKVSGGLAVAMVGLQFIFKFWK